MRRRLYIIYSEFCCKLRHSSYLDLPDVAVTDWSMIVDTDSGLLLCMTAEMEPVVVDKHR